MRKPRGWELGEKYSDYIIPKIDLNSEDFKGLDDKEKLRFLAYMMKLMILKLFDVKELKNMNFEEFRLNPAVAELTFQHRESPNIRYKIYIWW